MVQPRPLILFFNPVRHALADYQALGKVADTQTVTSKSREEFFQDLSTKYQSAQVIYRTSASGAVAGNFDKAFIDRLPDSLLTICHNGAGYDQIDTAACKARGITLTYAPDSVTEATADLTIFLLLGALRQLNPGLLRLRQGNFKKDVGFGNDPSGKTLGILGMGRIGKAVAQRARAFGMNIIYYTRTKPTTTEAEEGTYVGFDELLSTSDVISVHVPLFAATKHLISKPEIDKMKKGIVIVNTARGAIIDESAMADALESGHITSVGLDVYEKEPIVNEKLISNERALLVPHLGTHTAETLAKMERMAMENARRAISGEQLLTPVPEHCN
ncbi:hypothetical protein V499_07653 [Pseudogymnoascus sp. VKM F-103]|nr:hypothetical protein V499_07653 [Pseudogymnoascus sp. VKM F-103]